MHDFKKLPLSLIVFLLGNLLSAAGGHAASGCTTQDCHAGIRDIVPMTLDMMQLIKRTGQRHGDPDGCVVCHGGNPDTTRKSRAHRSIPPTLLKAAGPKAFYPDPGSIWIAKNTCGVCHPGFVYRVTRSLMNTEAGKIQDNLHAWGILKDYQVPFGNYDIKDTDGPVPMGASKAYETYMAEMMEQYPDQYPASLSMIPLPDIQQMEKDPALAGLTYQRQECQRCHIGVRGKQMPGDFRGMGCAACHMPYSNDGFYQGQDRSIPKDTPGHILTHRLIGNRKTGGIPVETCNSCHSRGKKIGVSYLGMMAGSYQAPFDSNGDPQKEVHGKTYVMLPGDLHGRTENSRMGNPAGGLLCQDCHTSMDVHGDGNIHGTTLAQVEIECTDCHGTPDSLPWELALGHKDEFGRTLSGKKARGVAQDPLLASRQFGFNYDRRDGFLLTARGNPLGNVIKDKESVIVHSARGLDFKVPLLRQIKIKKSWKNRAAQTAMSSVSAHLNRMECYTCHASWAPQSYGRYVNVDYQKRSNQNTDWVASGNAQMENGQTAESKRGARGVLSAGTIEEHLVYLRWEDPVLGMNGEGNLSPLIPGAQVVYTVIGRDGTRLARNQVPGNEIEALAAGQDHVPSSLDTAPAQPHTNQRKARSCENCHTNPKASGLGLWEREDLPPAGDWSKIVTREGKQTATVGTHWPLSRALDKDTLDRLLKTGTCIGCHINMMDTAFWQTVSKKGLLDPLQHEALMNQVLKNRAGASRITP